MNKSSGLVVEINRNRDQVLNHLDDVTDTIDDDFRDNEQDENETIEYDSDDENVKENETLGYIPCAAHNIQLVVKDGLKLSTNYESLIKKVSKWYA